MIDPDPVPLPVAPETKTETTLGVTDAAIDFTFIDPAPRSTKVRDFGHVPSVDKYIACVRMSAQAFTVAGAGETAVDTPPATNAPTRKPIPILSEVERMNELFIVARDDFIDEEPFFDSN